MPELKIDPADIQNGKVWIVKLLTAAGMAPSNSEARRLIQQGGVTLDGEKISDPSANIEVKNGQVLRAGKLKFARIAIP
jgi:tyrosyl-tRNA synthetase